MTPAKDGLAFAQSVPNAQVVQMQNSGHSLMTEAPDALLDTLVAFLA
jgi:pimeloyl-ACP methyl ester carboxylesterase